MKTEEDGRSALKTGCLVDSQGSSVKPGTPAMQGFLWCGSDCASSLLQNSQCLPTACEEHPTPQGGIPALSRETCHTPWAGAKLSVGGEPSLLALLMIFLSSLSPHFQILLIIGGHFLHETQAPSPQMHPHLSTLC